MITSCQHEEGMSFGEIKQKVRTSDQQIRWDMKLSVTFVFDSGAQSAAKFCLQCQCAIKMKDSKVITVMTTYM